MWQQWVIGLGFIGATSVLGYSVGQSDFFTIIASYAILFLMYFFAFRKSEGNDDAFFFFVKLAILARVLLIFGLPLLSDDVYRFIWDGRLLIQGVNPFDHLPSWYMENQNNLAGINEGLFQKLNSPEYFTIYPPVCQAVFAFSCLIFPNSELYASMLMKLFLVACEIGSIYLLFQLLSHFKLPKRNTLLYALNPLIIIEISGNLHFEGAMIFFLLLAIYFLVKEKKNLSAIAMALSVASKLLPLIFLPFLLKRLGWAKAIKYYLIGGLSLLILFAPMLNGVFLNNFSNSLNLYFQKFEFNASLYYVFRWVGFKINGYNMIADIGPMLAASVFVVVMIKMMLEKKPDLSGFPGQCLFAICVYLLCTTTVHPWYCSLPIVLCVFGRFRFPILWSGLILMTYINYSYDVYQEQLWVVGLEYLLVFVYFFYEWFFHHIRHIRNT